MGGKAAIVDPECALNPEYARMIGVDVDELLYSQPDSGEAALSIVEALVRSGKVGLVVIDSVAALVPQAELDGEMDQSQPGLQARMMGKAMRKLTGCIAENNCAVIFINQMREKIGVMFGSPETTPGGKALKFYASVRLDVRKAEAIKSGDDFIGHTLKCKVVKSKVSIPFRQCEFVVLYGKGVDQASELTHLGVQDGIIHKSGNWLSVQDGDEVRSFNEVPAKANGIAAFKRLVEQCPDLYQYLKERITANTAGTLLIATEPVADKPA